MGLKDEVGRRKARKGSKSMKGTLSIAAVLIVGVGLCVALAAWWQISNAESELAALREANAKEVARLLQTIAKQEGSLRDQELDYSAKLRELAKKDSELNAFLKNLLAESAVAPDSEPRRAPKPASAENRAATEQAPVEPERIEHQQRQQLSWEDDHNADGVIDGNDLAIVHDLANRGSQEGDDDFDPAADLDGDGAISLSDTIALWQLLRQHGQTNPE